MRKFYRMFVAISIMICGILCGQGEACEKSTVYSPVDKLGFACDNLWSRNTSPLKASLALVCLSSCSTIEEDVNATQWLMYRMIDYLNSDKGNLKRPFIKKSIEIAQDLLKDSVSPYLRLYSGVAKSPPLNHVFCERKLDEIEELLNSRKHDVIMRMILEVVHDAREQKRSSAV